jgi:hypothetical protein
MVLILLENYLDNWGGMVRQFFLILWAVATLNTTAQANMLDSTQKACDEGNMFACSEIGIWHLEKDNWVLKYGDIKPDPYKAKKIFRQGCNKGHPRSCAGLAVQYFDGNGARQNYFKAFEFAKKACDGDYGMGCNILGILHDTGKGVRKDSCSALKYFGKACDNKDPQGCDNYSRMLEETKGECSSGFFDIFK